MVFIYLKEGSWTNINRHQYPDWIRYLILLAIAIDPKDETIWAGSYGGGLLNVKNGSSLKYISKIF